MMKKFWISVIFWQSYRHQLVVRSLGHSVCCQNDALPVKAARRDAIAKLKFFWGFSAELQKAQYRFTYVRCATPFICRLHLERWLAMKENAEFMKGE